MNDQGAPAFVFHHTKTDSSKRDEKKGLIKYYVESIQTGSSLFTKERKAETTKNLINAYLVSGISLT